MRKTRKKGFTIVELVIVIAVIAILAAVLIPTFTNVINNAKKSAAQADAKNVWTQYCVDHPSDFSDKCGYVVADGYHFEITNGQISVEVSTAKENWGKPSGGGTWEAVKMENQNVEGIEGTVTYEGLYIWTLKAESGGTPTGSENSGE